MDLPHCVFSTAFQGLPMQQGTTMSCCTRAAICHCKHPPACLHTAPLHRSRGGPGIRSKQRMFDYANSCIQTWAGVPELEFISRHHSEFRVVLGEDKVRQALLVEGHIPAHCDVLSGLCFLQALVIVCLELYQWSKHILVNIGIVIPVRQTSAP